jgi:hypothetical protein
MSVPALKVAADLAVAASSLIDEVLNNDGEEREDEVADDAANLLTASLKESSFAIVTSPWAFSSVALFEFNKVFESEIFFPEAFLLGEKFDGKFNKKFEERKERFDRCGEKIKEKIAR